MAGQKRSVTTGRHVEFIEHSGKRILVVNFSNCSARKTEEILRAVPDYVNTKSREPVLILANWTNASIDREVVRTAQQIAVFDKPYVKKAAWIGTNHFPRTFLADIETYSRRKFSVFDDQTKALEWLASDADLG